MRKQRQKYPDLNDLAFSGRNKDYGSYILRKKYPRSLLFSFILSIVIVLLMTLIPLGVYYFQGPDLTFDMEELYSVEYTFIPSPEDDLGSLAKALIKPPAPAVEQVPQVVDTVIPEKKKAPEEVKKEDEKDVRADSVGASQGQAPDGKGASDASGIFTTLDVYPKFPGGDQSRLFFLRSNIKYPLISLKMGTQGEVMVLFVVEPDGSISNVSVNKGIGKECDEEAVRVTKSMPRWEPGRRNGKSVRVLVRMPIVFKIPGKK
ncbi:MAG TPA: TonB family protein [Bacteroidales bacterium]|nr:TonB family protein [Bacteroidales bacterium]